MVIMVLTLWISLLSLTSLCHASDEIEVREIEVTGLHSITEQELLYLLELEAGVPTDRAAVRRGIKRAFLKGIFENIIIVSDESREGILIVEITERDIIGDIRVEGTSFLSPRFIEKELGLSAGSRLRYDLLEGYKEKVLDIAWQKGFHDAEVSLEVRSTGKPYEMKLIFTLTEGEPTYIREINILGANKADVIPNISISEDSFFDQYKLRKDIESLTSRYKKMGYLNPVVGPYTFSDGVLHMNVDPGKRLEINIKGNNSVSGKDLRAVMPFGDAGEIRDDLIDEAVQRMTSVYHSRGYPQAQVATVVSQDGNAATLNFYVFEGPKIKVQELHIRGISLSEENLKQVLLLKEGEVYNPDLLDRTVRTIRDFYNALGYVEAEVSHPEVDIKDADARIIIDVKEGPQFVISKVELAGVKSLPEESIISEVGLKVGAPYNEIDILDARRAVVSYYRKHGFQDANVEVERNYSEGNGVEISFVVDEGSKLYFGRTVIAGNIKTKYRVIERELEHSEGDPLNKALLLRARQEIYKTGLFSDVNIELLERYDHSSDVLIDVDEGKAGAVEFGLGYGEYDRFRWFLDISYRNLFGMNRHGAFRVESSSLLTRYILRYNEPWFLNRRIPMRAYLISEDRKEINIDTGDVKYRVERMTAGIGVTKKLSEALKLDLLYEYSFTDTFDVAPDVILSKEDTGTLGISSITPSLTYDTRDNPFDPTRGFFAGVSLKTATVVLFSETDFFKLESFVSRFHELSRRLVLAASIRGGFAQGMRDTTDLPLVERFFLGGRSTVRGFPQDGLGPKGEDGNPVGGNSFILGNLEFRLRIAKNWRLVPFFDTGAVWLDDDDMDFSELRYTAGIGLQYNTPVGPIRLDYGHKLDREPGESSGEVHFSIGHAF